MRVCFVALNAYPLFDPRVSEGFGGMETRAWLFARGLARRRDVDVSFLVRDHGQPRRQRIDGVSIRTYRDHRFARQMFRPRVNPIYAGIGADVYVSLGVNWLSAEVVRSAPESGAKSVVLVASDFDLAAAYRPGSDFRSPCGEYGHACHVAISRSDALVVQTIHQQRLARERFGVEASLVANPVDLSAASRLRGGPPVPRGRFVLWVGRSDTFHKRPDLCLAVARRCLEVPFVLAMNRYDSEVHDRVERELPPNALVIERVPFRQMPRLYRDAAALLSTSSSAFEGFPNVFLQAGAHGVPVLSLEADPDGVLRRGAGHVAGGDLDRLAVLVSRVWREPRTARRRVRVFWEHLRTHHDLDARVADLRSILAGVVDKETVGQGLLAA